MERVLLGLAAIFVAFVILFALATPPESPLPDLQQVQNASQKHPELEWFENEVVNSKEPVLVDFGATWCGPCRMIAPFVDQLEKEYEGRVKVVRVDMDEKRVLCDSLNVNAIPYLLLVKDGAAIDSMRGVPPGVNYKFFQEFVSPALR